MKSFISEVADDVLNKHPDIASLVFILPGKRAGTFLKNELRKSISSTVFAPTILAIEDFVQDLSGFQLAPNLQILFEFYEAYKTLTPTDERDDFYTFSQWAQILVQDFNEIDRYLIEPEKIFSYLASIRELNHWTLDPEKTPLQKNYLAFWEKLPVYYKELKTRLRRKQIGYQGMIYKEALENTEYYLQSHSHNKHIFIGFNALNNAETAIIKEFLQVADAEIYWDIDKQFLNDPEHDAGLFIRSYLNEWKHFEKHPPKILTEYFSSEKNIQIIGVPKNVGQAKYAGQILHSLQSETNKDPLAGTAVVLGKEDLLDAVLNSVPAALKTVNITSGFPLENTPVASFFLSYIDLLEKENNGIWYYKDLLTFLTHPLSSTLFWHHGVDVANEASRNIHKNNITHIHPAGSNLFPADLKELIKLVFNDGTKNSLHEIIERCSSITLLLKQRFTERQDRNVLFLEYLYRFYEIFNQIKHLQNSYGSMENLKSFKSVFKELLLKESIDFKGEPLEGLQIMGVLESRNLDFETVIITSVNEGILPSGKTNNSFLPFDIKIAFGLPTYREKDAIYGYHFYRLLQRAKNIYLLYNTEPDVLEGGEKSRFLMQLSAFRLPQHHVTEIVVSPAIKNNAVKPVTILKSPVLLEKLKEIAAKGFSPTSLTNYIRNPIDFYYQSVLGVKEIEEIEETIAANTLGTIVHNTLEHLYTPLIGETLTVTALEAIQLEVEKTVNSFFNSEFKGGDYTRGKNLISFHVAKRYVENFLAYDKARIANGDHIKILELESNLNIPVALEELPFPVHIKGKVDRVEEVNGIVRIIDYKTGKVLQSDMEIVLWDDLTLDYKYSKAFQVLSYSFMMKETFLKGTDQLAEAGIISFKNLNNGFLPFIKKDKKGPGAQKNSFIDREVLQSYENALAKLILEIFDPALPFVEKEQEFMDF